MTIAEKPLIIRRICAALQVCAERRLFPRAFYLTEADHAELIAVAPNCGEAIGGVEIRRSESPTSKLYTQYGISIAVPKTPPP